MIWQCLIREGLHMHVYVRRMWCVSVCILFDSVQVTCISITPPQFTSLHFSVHERGLAHQYEHEYQHPHSAASLYTHYQHVPSPPSPLNLRHLYTWHLRPSFLSLFFSVSLPQLLHRLPISSLYLVLSISFLLFPPPPLPFLLLPLSLPSLFPLFFPSLPFPPLLFWFFPPCHQNVILGILNLNPIYFLYLLGMLSESKAEGAEPLALMMIGSMERGTIYETVTLNVISSPFSSLLLDLCIHPSACLLVCLSVSLSLCQSICLSILRSYTPSSSLSPPPLFHTHTRTRTQATKCLDIAVGKCSSYTLSFSLPNWPIQYR